MILVLADRIHTLGVGDDDVPAGRGPTGMVVWNGRIIAVDRAEELEPWRRSAEVLDLRGTTLTPGITDAHLHLVEWARARRQVDLSSAATPGEAAEAVGRYAAATPSASWVRGRGWNPHRWRAAPTRTLLDRHVPDRPVALHSHDLHALWVNTRALEQAGITAETPDPGSGRIVRDPDGEPTGVLLEDAVRLVLDRIPRPTDAEDRAAVLEAQTELHRLGITGVHSVEMPGRDFASLRVVDQLRAADRLRLRVLQHLPLSVLEDAVRLGLRSGFGGDWLRIGGVKMFLDGALGSRTAWLREPYEGSDDRGVQTLSELAFREAVRTAAEAGIASTVHAIGDAAVSLALDVLSGRTGKPPALPHRIEHVQLCPPDRFGDAARAGIVCSVQPAHLMTDWQAVERHWGRTRARGAYAFRSLLTGAGPDRPAVLAFGSDAPVEPVDPRLGLYAAVVRRDRDGEPEGGWFPAERLTPAEAFRAYTVGPARAAGLAGCRGRLAAGFDADFVAWDRDPLTASGRELLELRCVATVVAGEVVWREGAPHGE